MGTGARADRSRPASTTSTGRSRCAGPAHGRWPPRPPGGRAGPPAPARAPTPPPDPASRDANGLPAGRPSPGARVHRALLARGETVAAAESLTAGLFCATLADGARSQRHPARRRRRLRHRPEGDPGRRAARTCSTAHGAGEPGDGGRARRRGAGEVHRHVGGRAHRRRRARPGRRARPRAASTSGWPDPGAPTSSGWTCRATGRRSAPALSRRPMAELLDRLA